MRERDLISLFVSALLLFLAGCASDSEANRVRGLRRGAGWPEIKSIAEREVAQRRKDANFARSAFYAPEWHQHGIWFVVVSSVQRQGAYYCFAPGGLYGGYPGNMWQDVAEISVRDGGEVASYSTH